MSYQRPVYGRLVHHDERSRDYNLRTLLATKTERKTKSWTHPTADDQGQTPQCVGHAMHNMLGTSPVTKLNKPAARPSPLAIYAGAQTLDPWHNQPHAGTTSLAAAQWLKSQGRCPEYRWGFTTDDVLDYLANHGPVTIGTDWLEDMENPDRNGRIRATGRVLGGHQTLLFGIDTSTDEVRGLNSWGTEWGDRGTYRLSFDDLDKLLANNGDALVLLTQ